MGAGEDAETDDIDVFLDGRLDDLFGSPTEAGIDDLHAGIPQGPADHFGPPIMAVQARLGD